ncbi:hypothetical protein LOAG_15120 [Loa loa]|uniref:Uncharacterized protein n=1 Tax=Loa loa TaxID=7209 RepID=A0A1S0THC9_LOALO|nr:hypothetical protein LOAG_15120 [Loa loa]EFO13409.2 hypothetical protein LOAG_15120 [Loa loa]
MILMFQYVSVNLCTLLEVGVCLCLLSLFDRVKRCPLGAASQPDGDGDELWLGYFFQTPVRVEQAALSLKNAGSISSDQCPEPPACKVGSAASSASLACR